MSRADMNKGLAELFDEMVATRASLVLAEKVGSTRVRGRSAIGAFEKYCISHDDGRTRDGLLARYEVTLQISGETLKDAAAVDRLQEIYDNNSLRLRGSLLRRETEGEGLRGTLRPATPVETPAPTSRLRINMPRREIS